VRACIHAWILNRVSIYLSIYRPMYVVDQNPRVPDVARVWAESKEQKDQWVQSIRKVLTRFQEGTESKALNLRPLVTTVRASTDPIPSVVCSPHLHAVCRVVGRVVSLVVLCASCVGRCYSHEPRGQRRKDPPRATKREAAAGR
jgi:hypothetical protein